MKAANISVNAKYPALVHQLFKYPLISKKSPRTRRHKRRIREPVHFRLLARPSCRC